MKTLLLALFPLLFECISLADDKPHVDWLGDPLPPGALVRLGTQRLRGIITNPTFSEDGKLLSCGFGKLVRIRNAENGKVIRAWKSGGGERGGIVSFKHDLNVSQERNEVFVHRLSTERLLKKWTVNRHRQIWSMALSPNGEDLALGTYEKPDQGARIGRVVIWNIATGRSSGPEASVSSSSVSRDGFSTSISTTSGARAAICRPSDVTSPITKISYSSP